MLSHSSDLEKIIIKFQRFLRKSLEDLCMCVCNYVTIYVSIYLFSVVYIFIIEDHKDQITPLKTRVLIKSAIKVTIIYYI